MGASVLLLGGCEQMIGAVSESPSRLYVQNDSAVRFYVGATFDADATDLTPGDAIKPGQRGEVGWDGCFTNWLVFRKSSRRSSVEFDRHQVTLCMGDTVTVDENYALSIECGERSLDTRAASCDDEAADTR